MKSIDEAQSAFLLFKEEFNKYKNEDLSETDTRSKILDELFKSVLGWKEEDIEREGYNDSGYYDYSFRIPGFHFVVEAKKNYAAFILPEKHKKVTIETLRKGNKEVIKQIRDYLIEEGLQFGIISNGHQFIIGKFINIDGTKWKSNTCLIFRDIEDIENRFIEFYNTLSKFTVVEKGGFSLKEESEINIGQKIINSLPNKNKELIRNSLSSQLAPIIDNMFGEIYKYEVLDNEELIRECFILNEEIKKNKSDIERLFDDTPPELEEIIPARNTISIKQQIEKEIEDYPIVFKEMPSPKPIIIVGSKGAGKTTFINYLFKVNFTDEFKKTRPHVYLNFIKYTSTDLTGGKKNILRDILELFYDKYPHLNLHSQKVLKRIYIKEINRFDKSIWLYDKENNEPKYFDKLDTFLSKSLDDYENHFNKVSEYLIRERRIRPCLIIDNADQLNYNTQKEVFLFAQSLNKKAKCLIIISLREGYYYKWRHHPPFDAFVSNVYHVTAPKYKDVLQKRIDYALKKLKISGKSMGVWAKGMNVQLDNKAVKDFILSIKTSLFGEQNSEMLSFLEKNSYPNIRTGLEIFKHFLLSGHTNVVQYIVRQRTDTETGIPIPIWEFIKSIALDNKIYYNHEISEVHNLFFPEEGSTNHFTKIKILKFLCNKLKVSSSERFSNVEEIITIFTNSGYPSNIIYKELFSLLQNNLIETDEFKSDVEEIHELNNDDNIKVSLKGYYYANVLIGKFSYLDVILQDTPIFNPDAYSKIKEKFPLANEEGNRNLSARKETVELFIEYLKAEEEKETIESSNIAQNIISELKTTSLNKSLGRINAILRAEKRKKK